jgi:uncharacterized protein with ParB-like and HNH nuclease domain
MAKVKRGFKFTTGDFEAVAEAVEELKPISTTECEQVWNQHITRYPNQQQTLESLKSNFRNWRGQKSKQVIRIRVAKCAYYAIAKKTHDSIFGIRSDDENGEEGKAEGGNGNDSNVMTSELRWMRLLWTIVIEDEEVLQA